MFTFLLLALSSSFAHEGHPQMALESWDRELIHTDFGSRWAAIVELEDDGPIEVDVFDGISWKTTEEIFRMDRRVLIQTDLDAAVNTVLIHSDDRDRVSYMEWDLVEPVYEPRGPAMPPNPASIPAAYQDLGVISRADWGARASYCTTTEDDWYRMAIHHTAGHQDTNGTIEAQVQWLQVFFQDTRGYCDIAYQWLVGKDGNIWEGRPYGYYSAATGGNQNNGNMAISFMGCYDSTECDVGPHTPTETMLDRAHDLVYTISLTEDIETNSDNIKGHNDWPGNNTACPGDYIEPIIPEWFVPPGPDWAAELSKSSFALSEEAPIVLEENESMLGTFEFVNTGRSTWNANTKLAPLPRDVDSPIYGDDWEAPHRVISVSEDTAPGEVGVFEFSITGREAGATYQSFGLLQEGNQWFDEDGGIEPAEITLRVVVAEDSTEDSGGGVDTGDVGEEEKGGCACASSTPRSGAWVGFLGLVGVLISRRR